MVINSDEDLEASIGESWQRLYCFNEREYSFTTRERSAMYDSDDTFYPVIFCG
jgi:hypothetical protein